jgi:hypothetical protein
MATDPRTGREVGDHGTANDAIEFILTAGYDCGPGEEVEFLRAWQQGDLGEWPEFYRWLSGRQ